MGSDAAAAHAPKDLGGRRKKANRSAKLKQCKLDARREQWLSHVKNKSRSETEARIPPPSPPSPSSPPPIAEIPRPEVTDQTVDDSSPTESISVEEIEDDSPDDWETVAETLTIFLDFKSPQVLSPPEVETAIEERIPRAWTSDDIFRPQSLPNLQIHPNLLPSEVDSSCPVCYEELDPTDSRFQPCCCGFRLCLFCHKKILESDGRCPGCRKLYGDDDPPLSAP